MREWRGGEGNWGLTLHGWEADFGAARLTLGWATAFACSIRARRSSAVVLSNWPIVRNLVYRSRMRSSAERLLSSANAP